MDRCDSTRLITHHPKGRCPGVPVYFLDPLSDHTDNMSLSQGLKKSTSQLFLSLPHPLPSLLTPPFYPPPPLPLPLLRSTLFLPLPRRLCFQPCLFVGRITQNYQRIFRKSGGKVARTPRKKRLDFGDNADHVT